jgi:hypothetical protein
MPWLQQKTGPAGALRADSPLRGKAEIVKMGGKPTFQDCQSVFPSPPRGVSAP